MSPTSETPQEDAQIKTIVFLHPDLGIGGAERLVVDAAVGLQKRGHKVVIFTSHCDPNHCFDEARDGTLDVRVRGNTLIPPHLLGRFAILCAILRQLHLILQIALLTSELPALAPSCFFVDQLSAGLPLLRLLLPATPVFFYCHFPDLLLARGRGSLAKRLYRVPFDRLEQASMAAAAAIAVNSRFTKSVVAATWPALAASHPLRVIYPCIAIPSTAPAEIDPPLPWWGKDTRVLLSINRFERKKDVGLALRAFAALAPSLRRSAKLVCAGGYDARVAENVEYHAELVALAASLGLTSQTASSPESDVVDAEVDVLFLLSVPGPLKDRLLRAAALLVYTPRGEHFGIVPLEAMLAGTAVLAARDGAGPTETVVDGETGWLRAPGDVAAWSEVMGWVLAEGAGERLREMGRKGERRVRERFSRGEMARAVDEVLGEIIERERGRGGGRRGVAMLLGLGLLAVAGALLAVVVALVIRV